MANNPAYDPIIAEASRRYNVPEQTIRSVMGVESAGRRDAVSPKGASGLMQVMPETYAELARKHGLGPDRFEPRNNIMAGTAYLRENNDRFGGDWTKTLQAYNAGPGAVESGRPLPAETQAYVPKVQAGMGGGLTREAVINELRRRGKLPPEFDTPSPAPKLTREAVINELRRRGKLPPEFDTPAPTPAPAGDSSSVSAWGELGRGFLKGVDTVQGAGGFVLETLGDKTGFQGLEDYGQGIRERNKTEADQYKLRVNRIEDVHSVGDFADYAAGVLGSFGPQVGVSVAGAGLAALAAPAVGIGAGLAAGVGAAATSFPMNAGEVFQNLLDKGIDRDTAMNIGLAAGIPMAALDAIVPGKVGSRVAGAVAADAGSTLLGRTVKGGIKGSGQEGLTETMQEGTSILAEDYAGVAPTFQEAKSRLLNAGVAGAIAGGPMGAVGGSLERVTPAPAVVAPPATAAPPAPPPPVPPVAPPGAAPVPPVAPPPVTVLPPTPVAAPATLPGYQPFFDQDGVTQLGWQSPDGSTVVAMGQSTAPLPTAPDLRTELDQVVNSAKPVAEIVAGNDLHGLLPGEIEMPAYDPMTGEEAPGFYHEASDTWRAAGEAPNFELSSVAAEVQTPSNTVQSDVFAPEPDANTLQTPPQPLEPAIQPLSPPVDEAPSPQIRTNPYEVEGREHIVRPGPQRPPPPPRPALPGEPFVNPPPSADPTVSPKSLYDELRQRGEVKGAGIEDISKPPREGSVGDTWQAKRDADLEALGGEPKAPPVRAELPEGARRGYDYLYGDVRTALALPHGKERNEAVSAARARLTRYVNDALAASFDPETLANKERARRLRAIGDRYEAIGKTDQAKKYRDMAAAPPKVDGSGETAVNYLDQWEHIVEIDEKAARGDFTVTQPPKRGPVAPPEPVANIDTEVIVRDEESRLAENIAEGFKHVPADIRKAATDRLNDLARLRAERGYDGKDEPQRHMKPHAIDQIDQRRDNLLAAYNRYVRFLGAQKLGRKQAKYKDGKTEPLYTPETVARELASLQTLLDAPLPTDADLAMDFSGYDVFQLDRHANTYGDASEDGAAALAELRKRPGWGNRRPLELVKERQDIIAKLREEKSPERYAELEAQASSIEEDLARDPAWESYFKYNHNRVTGRHENLTPRQTAEFVRGLADKEKQRGEGLKTKKAKERSAASAAESEAAAERLRARIPAARENTFQELAAAESMTPEQLLAALDGDATDVLDVLAAGRLRRNIPNIETIADRYRAELRTRSEEDQRTFAPTVAEQDFKVGQRGTFASYGAPTPQTGEVTAVRPDGSVVVQFENAKMAYAPTARVRFEADPQTTKRPFPQSVSMAEKALRERTVKPNAAAIARHLEITEEEAALVLAAVAGRSSSIIRQVQASKKERAAQGRGEGTVTAPRYRFTPRLNGPQTLIDLIASHGGLAPNGDLSAMDLDKVRTPGAGGMLVRKGGMSLDEARELAETEGFIGQETDDYQTTTVNELLEALDNEHRGSKVSTQDKGARHGPQRDQMEAAARALGVSVQDDWSDVELLTEIQESEAIRGDLEAEADIDRAIITSMLEDMGIFDLSLFTPVEEQDFDIPFPNVADGRNGRIEEAASAVAPPAGDVAEVPGQDPAGEAGAVRQGDRTPEGGTGEAGQAPGAGSQKPTARVEKTDQGDQYVFGGEAGRRTTMLTLKAKFPQEPANEGLFAGPTKTAAPEPEQLDIETALAPKPAESRLEALKKRVQLFASGMTRPVDIRAGSFSWGGLKTRGIGIEIGELSREGMQAVINAVVDRKASLFVDSGAFNLFMAKMRGMAGYDDLLKELGPAAPKPLNFDQILRRYDSLLEMIHDANAAEDTDAPKPLLVMPDIVGDQAGSIELVEKKAKYIGVDAEMNVVQPIVPIQKGALSLSEAYDKIVKILGTDQFIVGIPGGQKAVTLDELREFLTKSKPPKIHILGNISPKTLDPKLEVIAGIEGYDPIHVSADGNLLRSKLYGLGESTAGGKARAEAVSGVLRDKAGPEFDEAVNGPAKDPFLDLLERAENGDRAAYEELAARAKADVREKIRVYGERGDTLESFNISQTIDRGGFLVGMGEAKRGQVVVKYGPKLQIKFPLREVWTLKPLTEQKTPGTRLKWTTLGEWLTAAREIDNRKISAKRYEDQRQHQEALSRNLIEAETDPAVLTAALAYLKGIRPHRGARGDDLTTDLIVRANNRLEALNKAKTEYPLDPEQHPTGERVSDILKPGDWFIAPGGYGPYRVEDVRLASDGKEYISTNSLTDIRRTAETKKHLTPGNETVARVEGGRLWAFNEPDVPYLKVSESTANAIQDIAEESGAGIAQSEMKRMLAKPQKAPETTPKINEIKASDLAGLDEASIDALLDAAFGGEPAQKEPEIRDVDGIVVVKTADGWARGRYRDVEGEAPGWVAAPELGKGSTPEFAAKVPPELKPVEYYGRDGKLTTAFVRFAVGDRVRLKENGARGVVTHTGPGPNRQHDGYEEIPRVEVKFDNGVEQILTVEQFEAEPVSESPKSAQNPPENKSAARALFDKHFHFLTGLDELFPIVEAFVTGQQDFAATRAALKATIQKSDTWRESNGEKKASQLRADANLRALHTDMKGRGLSTTKQAPKAGASTEGTPPPGQRKVAEMLKPGDVVTAGGSTRYVVKEVRHSQDGGKWKTTVIAYREDTQVEGFEHKLTGAHVEKGLILHDNPGIIRKAEGRAAVAKPRIEPEARPMPSELGSKLASEQSAADILKAAGAAGVKGADEALTGLYKLFGGNKLSSGFTFDEDTYKAAKPHFQEAYKQFAAAGRSLLDFARFIQSNFGDQARPYLKRFLTEGAQAKVDAQNEPVVSPPEIDKQTDNLTGRQIEEPTGTPPVEPAPELPPGIETPTGEAVDAASVLASHGLKATKVTTRNGKPAWEISGNTHPVRDVLKGMKASWYGPKKVWTFWNDKDPSEEIASQLQSIPPQGVAAKGAAGAAADAGGGAGRDAGDNARARRKSSSDARLKHVRQREDARADERPDARDAGAWVDPETQALIRRGLQFGMPEEVVTNQIEDVALIHSAYARGKKLFLLANEAGTGKTFVLGGAIRELRSAGAKSFTYITMNTDLIAQIKRDLAAYGVDDVQFFTYSDLSKKAPELPEGAVLIFDETQNIKDPSSARGKSGQQMIAQAKFTLFASATPFENPVQAKYLQATGVFDPVGGHTDFAKMYGASVRKMEVYNRRTGKNETVEVPYWLGGKTEDGIAARTWFMKQGIMTQRPKKLPPGMVDGVFRQSDVPQEWLDKYNDVEAAYRAALNQYKTPDGKPTNSKMYSQIAMHRINMIKRILEASKVDQAIERAKHHLKDGKQVVIFVETKAEREVGKFRKTGDSSGPLYSYPEMALLMQRWEIQKAAAKGRSEDPPPFSDAILAISLAMHNLGVSFTLPSTSDEIVRALGKDNVAIYTGAVSGGIASKGKADFLAKRKSVLIATMAKGGTGLSLHDTTGDSPRVQIGLNLPWVASAVDQVSGRIARYGLQSKALIEWLFAGNIPFERSLAQRVGGRMRDMGALVKGIDLQAAGILTEFDLEEETLLPEEGAAAAVEVEPEGKEKEPSLPELLAMAEKLERTRKKLDDTSGGAFFTPYPLAAAMRFIGGVFAGDRVLEPSAGHGALVRFLPAHVTVDMIEQRRDNAEELARLFGKKEGHLVTQGDFLELAAELEGDYDTILMNPPFERAAGVGPLDIAHVRKAYELLAEGGRLVAIMGEGPFFREQSHDTAFRDWLEERGATVVRLPENVFKNSGTGVRARMVVLDEGATPGRSDIDLHDVETDSLEHLVRRIPVRERDRHGVRDRFKAPDDADTPNPPYRVGKMPDLGRVTFDKDGKWQRLGEHSIAWDTATDTPEFRARKDRIVKGIAELVERIGGGRMEAKVFDRIFRMGEADWSESWGVNIRSGPLAGLVALSMSSPDKAGVVRHEAIHFLRDTGLLDGADWRVLEAHAAAWRKMFDIDARYEGWYAEGDQDAILNEEAIADAYAAWANGYLDVKGPVARAFAKLKRFFEAVRNLLAGNGFTTADSVFRRIETGELARADRRTETETAEDYEGDVPGADGEGARYMLPPRRQGNLGQPYGGQGPAPVPPAAAPGRPVNQGNLFSVRTHLPDKSMVEWLMDANYSLIQRVQGATSRAAIGVSVDRFRQLTQDRYIRLRRVQEAVTGGTGRAIPQAENTYLAEELYTSKAGEKLFLMGRDHKQPILEAIHRAGLTVEQVDKYLYARHAKERNARISRINPRFPAGEGSGMTDADAQGIINAFTVLGILPQLDHIANLVDRMTNATLQERVNGGLMSAQEALKWQQTYRHYVPLRGLEQLDDTAMRPAGGQGYNVRGPESQRALGRKSRAESILGNVFMMADEAIIRSEKNQVVISLMNLVNNNVDPTYWQVDKVTIKPVFNKATGLVEYRATTKLSKEEEDRTVRCKVNGVEHRITIHDARLMTALKNLEATKVNMLIAGMMKFNRYLSTVNTGLNPEFLITNAFRDLQAGFINMSAADLNGLQTSVLRDYGAALKGAWGGVRGNGNTQWERYFREFAAAGGRVSFYQLDDLDQHKVKIERDLKRMGPGAWNASGRVLRGVFNAIADANAAVDNGIRLAVFVNARRLGKTDAEAASLAKNLTINFNRRGELGPVMNSAYLFFNAGVQGTAVLVKALKHKKVRRIVYGIVVAGFLMEMANAMISPDDDDGEDKYSKIPDFTKSRNFIIMSPDGTAITFPMPYGYNVFADLGRNLAALVRGHQSVARTMGNILKTSVDAFNPIGGTSSLLNFVSPTVLDPIVDLERNEDFAGRKIMPETPNERSKPDSQQYWSNTGPIYRTIAEQLNDLTGGNEWKKGDIDISPESLDYLFNWIAGGAGAFVLRTFGLGTKFLSGTEITMNDVPFARKVIARKGPGADRSLFYERAETIEALVAERKGLGKAGRTEEADALKGDLLKMATMAENIRTNLAALRKRRDGVKADGSLTSEERQKRLDELTKREKDQIDHFNRRYVEKVLRPEQEGRALINVR